MSKMLITGGAGFIGVNAAVHFLDKGWDVTVFDNFSRKGTELNLAFLEANYAGKFTLAKGDIRKAEDLSAAFSSPFDVVLHLAAQVAVTTSVTNPREDFDINALGTFNVLEAARAAGNKPLFIFASTNKVYGGLDDMPVMEDGDRYVFQKDTDGVTEAQPLDFHSPYGCSKGAADQYVHDYGRIYDLPTVVFRQSCVYGPHQMGIEDQGWVAWFMIAAMFGKKCSVYGNGKQVRDLLHVSDLVNAYAVAIEKKDIAAGKIYNMGGGKANTLSLLEFFDIMKADLGLPIAFDYAEVRPGDQPIFYSDNAKMTAETGWTPAIGIGKGLPELAQWLKEHKEELSQFYVR